MEKIRRPFILSMAILLLMFSSAESYIHPESDKNTGSRLSASVEEEMAQTDIFLPFEVVKLSMASLPAKKIELFTPVLHELSTVTYQSKEASGHVALHLSLVPQPNAP